MGRHNEVGGDLVRGMRSATKSGGSAQHTPSSEGTLTALESNQGIRGPEVDLTGRAEDACSVDSSSETWHHVEALDEVISASDSEGREVYIRGASPDRLSAKVLSKGFMEKDVAGPSAGPPISKAAKEIEKLSTPASATDNGLKSRPAEMHSSKRASAREMVPDGPNAQSDQQSPASGQAATVHKAGLLDANEGVNTQTPTVEGTGGKGSSSQDDAAGISEASQTTSVGKEDEESGHEGARRSQKERAQRSGSPDQGGGAWGWTSSWSKLTEQFREAASGAARDVQELTTSFQQVRLIVLFLKHASDRSFSCAQSCIVQDTNVLSTARRCSSRKWSPAVLSCGHVFNDILIWSCHVELLMTTSI